ncbi:MAG: DNA-binding protein [Rikenellaceae bacterium]
MVITFNELRRIKDKMPSGSMQRIADELNLNINDVRNYFGGMNHNVEPAVGIHVEKGPGGGIITLNDTTILDKAMQIISENVPS